jgi:uncharacterized DUF497 family protein
VVVVEITELLWDGQNIAHIGRHDVTAPEVSEVVFGDSALFFDLDRPDRPGRMAVFGVTTAGRSLAIYLDTPSRQGATYVLTARPMTTKERQTYDQLKEAGP